MKWKKTVMGYMGFGMRKEVYTRKAKTAFVRIKDLYGDQASLPKSKLKFESVKSANFEKHSYRPFYESKVYRLIKLIVFLSIGLLLVWCFCLQEPYNQYMKRQFEKTSFVEYYQTEM